MSQFARLAFTPTVQKLQEQNGSRALYARALGGPRDHAGPDEIGADERAFLENRDSFYLASVSETGWPYLQHRGGPKGFVRVLDEHTLGFADYRGNKQYISMGNLVNDDRVALLFLDYPNRRRLKVLAHASVVTAETAPDTLARLAVRGDSARVERGIILRVEGFDWNCPQHITPRYTEEEIGEHVQPLVDERAKLQREKLDLERRLAAAERR